MRAFSELGLLAILITACGAGQKPFDQMTAEEHLQAAARENQRADADFEKITGEGIVPPATTPTADIYYEYNAAPGLYDLYDPDAYIAWPRISDPSEKYEDAASKHRENALRHERAAAALEGRPSEPPLPPPQPPLITPTPT